MLPIKSMEAGCLGLPKGSQRMSGWQVHFIQQEGREEQVRMSMKVGHGTGEDAGALSWQAPASVHTGLSRNLSTIAIDSLSLDISVTQEVNWPKK
jgi:hypothetical protein